MFGKTQGKDMVSGVGNCNVDIMLANDDTSSISHCNVSSLDLSTSCNNNAISPCGASPCISYRNYLSTSVDDMLDLPFPMNKILLFPLVVYLTM